MQIEVERLIKKYLKGKMRNKKAPPSQNCPSELELSDYLDNRISQQRQGLLLEHIAACRHCLSLLELTQTAKEKLGLMPSPAMVNRAKNIVQKKPRKALLGYIWPALAFTSFVLSFVATRYFLQFLILAVIFSIKWIFDTGSTRTLIMIYEAWRRKDQGTARRIIQDFQNNRV